MSGIDDFHGLVVIPAYNEGRSVAQIACEALACLPVLVIDDGSDDDTAIQARLAGAEVIIKHRNQDKGAALITGFEYALDRGVDAVIVLDADGQHDPNEIPIFLRAYATSQADLIIGQRNFKSMPPVRRAANTFGTKIFSLALGEPIPDNQSGYRLISRRLMEVMPHSRESGFEFEVEMIVRCIQHRFSMEWVPIRTIYADEKSHINPLKHAVKFIQIPFRAYSLLRRCTKNAVALP